MKDLLRPPKNPSDVEADFYIRSLGIVPPKPLWEMTDDELEAFRIRLDEQAAQSKQVQRN